MQPLQILAGSARIFNYQETLSEQGVVSIGKRCQEPLYTSKGNPYLTYM